MLYAVELSKNQDDSHDLLRKIYKDYNERFNFPPTPLKEVGLQDALIALANERIAFVEYRQIIYNIDKIDFVGKPQEHLFGTVYFFVSGSCLFLTKKCIGSELRAFVGGCEHDFVGLSKEECEKRKITHYGRCHHVSACKLCGRIESVSSDD